MSLPAVKALVPMKDHSERVPQKNYRPFCGKPTLHWIMESLSASQYVDEIIVNTDSERVVEEVEKTVGKDLEVKFVPVNPKTRIDWHLPQSGPLSVKIHDLRGALVRTLVDERRMHAGAGHRIWDGRDDHGRGAPSGVYSGSTANVRSAVIDRFIAPSGPLSGGTSLTSRKKT